jgi:hypothetical protein
VHDCASELEDPWTKLSNREKSMIKQTLIDHATLPIILDSANVTGNFSAKFGHQEFDLWQQSLWHVVNETVFYDPKLHLTEKIFKPIVALRPFVLVAAPGNLAYLKSYGFKTFDQWIDESYDNEHDPEVRLDMIAEEITKLCAMSKQQLQQMHRDMLPVLIHNKQHFFGQFREIIVNELVENFDGCVRVWNNGRVDDRHLPLHPDLAWAKSVLLR